MRDALCPHHQEVVHSDSPCRQNSPLEGEVETPGTRSHFLTTREHDGATLGGAHVTRRSLTRALDVILRGGMTHGNTRHRTTCRVFGKT